MKLNNAFFSPFKKQIRWIVFGMLSLALVRIVSHFPAFVESAYSRGLFVGLRFFWDHSLALVPFPLLYPAIFLLLFILIRLVIRSIKKETNWARRLLRLGMNLLALVLGGVGLFCWLWGFNYSRIPIEQQLGLEKITPQKAGIIQEIDSTVKRLSLLRMAIKKSDSSALTATHLPGDLEQMVRTSLESLLADMAYPHVGRVRGRKILPKGWLIGMGATGIYIPFVGEGHYDGALHPVQHPAVLAHEMSHGYGFTDEGVCNFLAFLACDRSAHPMIQYAGNLMYFRYLSHDLFRMDPAYYRQLIPNLPQGIQADLEAIRENRKRYKAWFPDVSRKVYNRYLKSQGVTEGIKSYNRVVGLVAAWKEKG